MIRAIATDMDGTFLRTDGSYNREKFREIFAKMQAQAVHFIVASGNQYAQLRDYFPDQAAQITFISENGALVTNDAGREIVGQLTGNTVRKILACLHDFAKGSHEIEVLLCGAKAAYIKNNATQGFQKFAALYYHSLKSLPNFEALPNDPIVKVALQVSLSSPRELVTYLMARLPDEIDAVSSGLKSVDIMPRGINKGIALSLLLKDWHIAPDQLAVFGDSDNDAQMLGLTSHSFAMAAHSELAGQAAHQVIGSNDKDAVLMKMTELL